MLSVTHEGRCEDTGVITRRHLLVEFPCGPEFIDDASSSTTAVKKRRSGRLNEITDRYVC